MITDKPTKVPVVADNKQCNCPPSVATYIRWGNSTCPHGVDTIYSGIAAGSFWESKGGAVYPLCLPPDPQYLLYKAGYQNWVQLYGVQYETGGTPLDHSADRNVPCALFQVYGRTNKIMISSHYEYPSGWRREYYGYLMAGEHIHKSSTQFTCVDAGLEQIPGIGADIGGYHFYMVEALCGNFFLAVIKNSLVWCVPSDLCACTYNNIGHTYNTLAMYIANMHVSTYT